MRRSLGIGSALALVLAAEPVLAQRVTGNIVGTVKDDTGAILPGVTVSLTGEKVVGTQTSVTNPQGFYRFTALPPGDYDLSFELQGFAKMKRPKVQLSLGA